MKEAVGNTFIFNLVLVFIIIFILFLVGSSAYSKSFKVKGLIINIIGQNEKYDGGVRDEISNSLSAIGYRVKQLDCPQYCRQNGPCVDSMRIDPQYDYCVYKLENKTGETTYTYYRLSTYLSMELPFANRIRIPISGETRTFRT